VKWRQLDGLQRAGLQLIINCVLCVLHWLQATLPRKGGVFGGPRVLLLASSTYIDPHIAVELSGVAARSDNFRDIPLVTGQ